MMRLEMMARLSGGSSWKTERLDRGQPDITYEDLAGALAGLPLGPTQLMLVKYASHPVAELQVLAYETANELARVHRWRDDLTLYSRMSRLAVAEIVAPSICRVCLGRGTISSDTGASTCEQCGGEGIGALTWRERNAILHEGECRTITKQERRCYDAIYQALADWESEGIAYMATRL